MRCTIQKNEQGSKCISYTGKAALMSIDTITVESEEYYRRLPAELTDEESRHIAAKELSAHIMDRLGYRVEEDVVTGNRDYIYHIGLLVEAEKLMLLRNIDALHQAIGAYNSEHTPNIIVDKIKEEAKRYELLYQVEVDKSLWQIIKERLFTCT